MAGPQTGWLDWAYQYDPAPPEHAGYAGVGGIPAEIQKHQRLGVVVHSVEGWFTYVNPSAVMRSRGNSWSVTIMRSGLVWKHAPRPTFVHWATGGPAQNMMLLPIEMEGKDQPWTEEQFDSLVKVLKETFTWFGWQTPVLGRVTQKTQQSIRAVLLSLGPGSLNEHNWFDFTTCPNGRNQWQRLIAAMEDDLKVEDIDARIVKLLEDARGITSKFVRAKGQDEVWEIINGRRVWLVSSAVAQARGMAPDQSNVQEINPVQLLAWPEGTL